jgi:hypothetical protein
MEPVTEQRPVPGPVVYGYLRMPAPNQSRRAALVTALRGYCDRHELTLAGVYADSSGDTCWAPGFTGLLDAIGATGGYGVVVPSPAHLSTVGRRAVRGPERISQSLISSVMPSPVLCRNGSGDFVAFPAWREFGEADQGVESEVFA